MAQATDKNNNPLWVVELVIDRIGRVTLKDVPGLHRGEAHDNAVSIITGMNSDAISVEQVNHQWLANQR